MKGSLNCVIFSSKVLSPSLKFKKCSKTFEFCEVNTDSYKTILARGLNPCRKTFPCGTNFQKEEHTRSRRLSCIGDFVEYKEKQFLIRRSHIPVLRDFLTANFVIGDFVGTEYFQTFPFHVHLPPNQAEQHLIGKKNAGIFFRGFWH